MTGKQLKAHLDALYGRTNWVTRFSKLVGIQRSTIYRYLNDEIPIPRSLCVLIVLLEHIKAAGMPLPTLLSSPEYGTLVFSLPRLCAHCPVRNLEEVADAPLLRLSIPTPSQ